jgi:hypothetical protein
VNERALCEREGIPRSSLQKYRETVLEEGLHYRRHNRQLRYTKEGQEAVSAWRSGSKGAEVTHGIILKDYPNPNLIRLELHPGGEVANCRVRAGRWRPGQLLRPLERRAQGLYAFVGAVPR